MRDAERFAGLLIATERPQDVCDRQGIEEDLELVAAGLRRLEGARVALERVVRATGESGEVGVDGVDMPQLLGVDGRADALGLREELGGAVGFTGVQPGLSLPHEGAGERGWSQRAGDLPRFRRVADAGLALARPRLRERPPRQSQGARAWVAAGLDDPVPELPRLWKLRADHQDVRAGHLRVVVDQRLDGRPERQ